MKLALAIPFTLLTLLFAGCVSNNSSITKKTNQLQALQNTANTYCKLNSYLNPAQDWIIATLNYNNKTTLTNQQSIILTEVTETFKTCVNNILLVTYNASYSNAYAYSNVVIDYLVSKNVPEKKISAIFCNVTSKHNNATNSLHIVFLNSSVNNRYYDCINYAKGN